MYELVSMLWRSSAVTAIAANSWLSAAPGLGCVGVSPNAHLLVTPGVLIPCSVAVIFIWLR